ncbi:MAG TPA: DUF5683 domain-containing protein [Leadbetterella sp.]|nr:DUF5683 domain-containing protein [Leadbetterella sp.]
MAQRDSLANEKSQKILKTDSTAKKTTPFDTARGARLKSFGKNSKFIFRKTFGIDTLTQKEIPKIAFVRSMVFPGWGQITNKSYIKLPLIYGAAGVGVYYIIKNDKSYTEFKGYINEMQKLPSNAKKEWQIKDVGPFYSITLHVTAANQYRRYKQLSVVGMGLGWLLFAIEANVHAHLKSFDVSRDISLRISPSILEQNQTMGFKMAFNFK